MPSQIGRGVDLDTYPAPPVGGKVMPSRLDGGDDVHFENREGQTDAAVWRIAFDAAEDAALSALPPSILHVLGHRSPAPASRTASALRALVRLEALAVAVHGTADLSADEIRTLFETAIDRGWIEAGPLTWEVAATVLRLRARRDCRAT